MEENLQGEPFAGLEDHLFFFFSSLHSLFLVAYETL
jgi:hypothetical protein